MTDVSVVLTLLYVVLDLHQLCNYKAPNSIQSIGLGHFLLCLVVGFPSFFVLFFVCLFFVVVVFFLCEIFHQLISFLGVVPT